MATAYLRQMPDSSYSIMGILQRRPNWYFLLLTTSVRKLRFKILVRGDVDCWVLCEEVGGRYMKLEHLDRPIKTVLARDVPV